MKAADLRVGARMLARDREFTLLAILGLGLAIAMSLLLAGFAWHCFTYDAQVPDADGVYQVKVRRNFELGAPWQDLGPLLFAHEGARVPGVAATTGFTNWIPITMNVDGQARRVRSLAVLPGFERMMGIEAVQGDVAAALASADGFALTESAARRLLGGTDVIGRSLTLTSVENMKGTARVLAILRDPPANTTIPYEMLHGSRLALLHDFLRRELETGAQGWPGHVLVRVAPGASVANITARFQELTDASAYVRSLPAELKDKLGGRKPVDVSLAPLRDAYFDREVQYTTFSVQAERGSRTQVMALVAVAVLLLAAATFNYVSLATIRVLRRQREIGVRKVLGASRRQLLALFVVESLLVTMTATLMGVALAWAALPAFGGMMNHDLSGILTAGNLAAAVGLGVFLGLASSLYPAWIAFGLRPARVLVGRGSAESLPARRLRQGISILQVAAATALAAFGLAVYWQSRYAMSLSPGFDPEPLLVFEINEGIQIGSTPTARSLLEALGQQPAIAGVALSSDAVGRTKNLWTAEIRRADHLVRADVKSVSPSFFEVYGLRPLAGRLFTRTDRRDDHDPVVLNSLAARALGFRSPEAAVGNTLVLLGDNNKPTTKTIVGIAPDVRFYSLRETPAPIAYELWDVGATVTVRASGSVAAAAQAVREIWPRYYPDAELRIASARDLYTANYAGDARLARLLGLATAIALALAFFGAYVIAAETVQRRTREIALRRLFGARRPQVAWLIACEIGLLVGIAALLAIPASALGIARYLAPFVERSPLAYVALILAFAVTALVIAFAAARETRAAMRTRPALALGD